MMKKLLKMLIIIPVLYLFILPVYLAGYTNAKPCTGVEIIIHDSADYHFVTRKQLWNLVNGKSGSVLGQPVKNIPLTEIENRIKSLKELREAEVYLSIDGTLYVHANQRNPVMRIMPDNGGDYFMDEEGVVIAKRNLYNPRMHIIAGNINISSAMLKGISVLDTSIKNTILKDIYFLMEYINSNSFWSAQIDQIYVDNNDEINLIPRVGNQLIHLGSTDNFEGKLRNLKTFYDQVMPEVGWNEYSLINLEYKDQIVCKRR
jgi:cell division protein FtsQ